MRNIKKGNTFLYNQLQLSNCGRSETVKDSERKRAFMRGENLRTKLVRMILNNKGRRVLPFDLRLCGTKVATINTQRIGYVLIKC